MNPSANIYSANNSKRTERDDGPDSPDNKRQKGCLSGRQVTQKLPVELWQLIGSYLSLKDCHRLFCVCKAFTTESFIQSLLTSKESGEIASKIISVMIRTNTLSTPALQNYQVLNSLKNRVTYLDFDKSCSSSIIEICSQKFPKLDNLSFTEIDDVDSYFDVLARLSNLTTLWITTCPIEDQGIAKVNRLTNLQTLELCGNGNVTGNSFDRLPISLSQLAASGCYINDHAVAHISRLTNLKELDLRDNPDITGGTFPQLPILLTRLDCDECNIDDTTVASLSRLINLRELLLGSNSTVTGATFDQLPVSVSRLICSDCKIDDRAVANLSRLTNLRGLDLQKNSAVTGSTADQLPVSLHGLSIAQCKITNDSVAKLNRLTDLRVLTLAFNSAIIGNTSDQLPVSLRKLDCQGCRIDDNGVANLSHLTNLKDLNLANNVITGASFDRDQSPLNQLPISLRSMSCSECNIHDRDVATMSRLTNLRSLDLNFNFGVTASSFYQLPDSLIDLSYEECGIMPNTVHFKINTRFDSMPTCST